MKMLCWNLRVVFIVTMVAAGGAMPRVLGQGVVTMGNLVPVFDVDGKTPLAGPAFLAELYAAAPGKSLEPISASITPFLPAPDAGFFFNPVDVVIPGVPQGGTAVGQVVAWRASEGPTFDAANHPGAHVGASPTFNLYERGPGATGVALMPGFSLHVVVPEPSVLRYGLVCLAALAWWRRTRNASQRVKRGTR
jgi:hypothetical protein